MRNHEKKKSHVEILCMPVLQMGLLVRPFPFCASVPPCRPSATPSLSCLLPYSIPFDAVSICRNPASSSRASLRSSILMPNILSQSTLSHAKNTFLSLPVSFQNFKYRWMIFHAEDRARAGSHSSHPSLGAVLFFQIQYQWGQVPGCFDGVLRVSRGRRSITRSPAL